MCKVSLDNINIELINSIVANMMVPTELIKGHPDIDWNKLRPVSSAKTDKCYFFTLEDVNGKRVASMSIDVMLMVTVRHLQREFVPNNLVQLVRGIPFNK